jgi:hypothetical protein
MNSPEEIQRAAQSLILTLKRLEQELLELHSLIHDHGQSLYRSVTLEDWVDVIGVLSNLGEKSRATSKLCLEIHFQARSSRARTEN